MIKVLVVEDDPMVGKLHEHYLTQIKGFQLCDIVRNSDEALKIMQTKEYNLVILDIFMPGMDGLQLLAKIREQEYDLWEEECEHCNTYHEDRCVIGQQLAEPLK